MNSFQFRYVPVLLFAASLHAQHGVLMQPMDAVHVAEISNLFKSHYAKHGCPRAEAGIGPTLNDIQLRMEDGCSGGVSTWAGDYIVNRKTGEVRDAGGDG